MARLHQVISFGGDNHVVIAERGATQLKQGGGGRPLSFVCLEDQVCAGICDYCRKGIFFFLKDFLFHFFFLVKVVTLLLTRKGNF